jgi:hypothetical protein
MPLDTLAEGHVFSKNRGDLRQRDTLPPARLANCSATVIGVGAIGRQVALKLAASGRQRALPIATKSFKLRGNSDHRPCVHIMNSLLRIRFFSKRFSMLSPSENPHGCVNYLSRIVPKIGPVDQSPSDYLQNQRVTKRVVSQGKK